MKRLLSLVMSIIIMVPLMAGCGTKNKKAEVIEKDNKEQVEKKKEEDKKEESKKETDSNLTDSNLDTTNNIAVVPSLGDTYGQSLINKNYSDGTKTYKKGNTKVRAKVNAIAKNSALPEILPTDVNTYIGKKEDSKLNNSSETKLEVKSETKIETKPEVKTDTKIETDPEVKSESEQKINPETKPEIKPEVQPEKEDKIVSIPDKKLKQVINYTLGKDRKVDQEITKEDMESITEINGDKAISYLPREEWIEYMSHDRGIRSIEGLQYAINLERLDLSENGIKDLTPLTNLKNLTYIELDRNMLGDLTPLSSLTNLIHLNIYNNDQIDDMTAISNLKNLEWLDLHWCNRGKRKVNVQPLGNITTLKMVNLESNLVEDISFAKRLTNVQVIGVGANHIVDMTPLSDMINRIYKDGEYVDEEETYVGMLVQELKEPINIKKDYKKFIYEIPDPVKGLDEYIRSNGITPAVEFLSGEENENIGINYNEDTKNIEVIVKGNLEEKQRNINTKIILGYEKYSLTIKLNITQEAANNKKDISDEAADQAREAVNKAVNVKDIDEYNLGEARNLLKLAQEAVEFAKKIDSKFDANNVESKKLEEFNSRIKEKEMNIAEKKKLETIKAVDEAFALKDGLNKGNLQKAEGMLSLVRYKLRVVKELDKEFDKDFNLANKLTELENAIKDCKKVNL
ncbi:copper amine oxidase family protein,Leucine Rich Repeat (LRR)-containing protein,Transglutaminase-like superfamily protein [Clostridium putrefaciens]|uniref:Copper amine oxidase family protein,Leucine Rich Repeat (LRR)-containing protein,Transglutaminase-like superfamily protein n=1 Tax=Clostridium putrefaciens TaxID=99675 RepID=A0A381J6J8_9CLOT|nr:leucine-rich repeat domain-containing protein [Clostridium putrefaciens]SUY45419.1 copper amine oxidase family protein,Leucine Rich Repeat (LRR)-containing protein,Transglutaminase-like superfamily protein [Clostridium putrefaciens]